MAGTRTAPIVNATPNKVEITLHFIDASGDVTSQMLPIDIARTDAEIEAWAAKFQAGTNSSLWKITKSLIYSGAKDADNGVAEWRASVKSGINLLFKNVSSGATISERLIAPVAATMQGNQDIPLLSSTEATELIVATLVLIPTFTMQQAQYTARRERANNPVVNV